LCQKQWERCKDFIKIQGQETGDGRQAGSASDSIKHTKIFYMETRFSNRNNGFTKTSSAGTKDMPSRDIPSWQP
jgi:hypothetical protein